MLDSSCIFFFFHLILIITTTDTSKRNLILYIHLHTHTVCMCMCTHQLYTHVYNNENNNQLPLPHSNYLEANYMNIRTSSVWHMKPEKLQIKFKIFMFFLLCKILIYCKGLGLFLGSLVCSIDLCFCFHASTRLFWLLWPCVIIWYQVAWFLHLCSFSRLLLLFGVFCGSKYVFEIFILVLWNTPLISW